MKIVTKEELQAHNTHVLYGALKGAAGGAVLSGLIFTVGKRRFPGLGKLPTAFRTALTIAPPTFGASVCGELSSMNFDKQVYGQDPKARERLLSEAKRWNSLTYVAKSVDVLSTHKYKIIVGAWVASMWGCWHLVDRDPIMTKTQKLVQARVYAQFLTVGLLLGTIGLSVYEDKLIAAGNIKRQTSGLDESWKDIVDEEEKAELARGESVYLKREEKAKA